MCMSLGIEGRGKSTVSGGRGRLTGTGFAVDSMNNSVGRTSFAAVSCSNWHNRIGNHRIDSSSKYRNFGNRLAFESIIINVFLTA
jgi:hypothetical protein